MNWGARAKRTQLTDKFTFGEFKAKYGEDVLPMFVLDAGGQLGVHTQDAPAPGPGQVIIGLIRESKTEAENPALIATPATAERN